MEQQFPQIVFLLAVAVTIIVAFQRLHVPTSLGYLIVGVIVDPYTMGPVVDSQPVQALAEFGIVSCCSRSASTSPCRRFMRGATCCSGSAPGRSS